MHRVVVATQHPPTTHFVSASRHDLRHVHTRCAAAVHPAAQDGHIPTHTASGPRRHADTQIRHPPAPSSMQCNRSTCGAPTPLHVPLRSRFLVVGVANGVVVCCTSRAIHVYVCQCNTRTRTKASTSRHAEHTQQAQYRAHVCVANLSQYQVNRTKPVGVIYIDHSAGCRFTTRPTTPCAWGRGRIRYIHHVSCLLGKTNTYHTNPTGRSMNTKHKTQTNTNRRWLRATAQKDIH